MHKVRKKNNSLIKFILKLIYYNFFLKFIFLILLLFNKNFFVNSNIISKIKSLKKTDTIYIFGSGNSLNKFSKNELQKIFNSDTFGFNQAYYSSLPFKFYAFEAIEKSDILKDINIFNKIYLKNLFKYFNSNKSINLIIIKDPKLKFLKYYKLFKKNKKNFFFKSFIEIPANTIQEIELYYDKIISMENMLPILKKIRFLEKKRSSLISYIDIFRRAGYKHIKLVGVDLKNSKYFFQSNDYLYPNIYNKIPQSQPNEKLHKTENKKYGNLIFSEILKSYKKKHTLEIEFFNKKNDI